MTQMQDPALTACEAQFLTQWQLSSAHIFTNNHNFLCYTEYNFPLKPCLSLSFIALFAVLFSSPISFFESVIFSFYFLLCSFCVSHYLNTPGTIS
jgi:hypothetical protein